MSLLETKFHPPPLASRSVARPRLLKQMGPATQTRLRVLVAPAGFGKTTLVQQWLAEQALPYGWFTIDRMDDIPVRFMEYFVEALQRSTDLDIAVPVIQKQSDGNPLIPAMTSLINQLEGKLSHPSVLVLDDFHGIQDKTILDALTFWVDYAPLGLVLVLTSRTEPNLPLPRWKVKRFALCLYSADLLFNTEEIQLLCTEKGFAQPDTGFVESLQKKTAGWVAALHLALEDTLSATRLDEGGVSPESLGFSRDLRLDISEYLATEVFTELDESLQQFILDIFPLRRFDAGLCNQIRGRDDSAAFIQMLSKRELFIIPLDEQKHWFRLHDLFIEAARLVIRQTGLPGPDLRKLAEASLNRQLYLEAFEILVDGQDWEGLATHLQSWGNHLIREGFHLNLQGWLGYLPDKLLQRSARLQLLQAWCLVYDNKFASLPDVMSGIKARLPHEAEREALRVEIGLLDAYVERQRCHFDEAIELTQGILTQLDASELPLKSLAYFNLGTDLFRLGKLDEAAEMLRRAINQGKLEQRFSTVISSVGLMLWIYQIRGHYIEALNLHKSILTWVASFHENQQVPDIISCWQNSALVKIHIAMGKLNTANSFLKPMLRFVDTAEPLQKILTWYVQGEWLRHSGKVSEAREKLQLANALLEQQNADVLTLAPPVASALAKCDLDQGLSLYLKAPVSVQGTIAPFTALEHQAVRVRKALMDSRTEESERRSEVNQLGALAEHYKSYRYLALSYVYEALTLQAQGHAQLAAEKLLKALLMGETNDYVSLFHPYMGQLDSLFTQIPTHAVNPDYLKHILENELPAQPRTSGYGTTPWPTPSISQQTLTGSAELAGDTSAGEDLQETLSRREMEVLREIEQGKPNKVIAQVLNLSPATVKAHIRNINGKLGATNRTEAIALARKKGLLGG